MIATTAEGNQYEALEYVDPFPGRKGSDRIWEDCGFCLATGIYQGPSGLKIYTATVGGVDKGCFQCNGTGRRSFLVSSARGTARRRVARENEYRANVADLMSPAAVAAREAAEAEEARQAAEAEAARRAALVQGFVAEVGERIRGLKVEVVVNHKFSGSDYYGREIQKSLLIFRAADGKVLKWVTEGRGLEVGAEVVLSATVKAHGNYEGQDQTVLTRGIIK